jgi:predicted ribosomally synthesized six-cysteine peptide SCIFF
MKHIVTIAGKCLRSGKNTGCGQCQNSCQSACKTSCTVANQVCNSRDEKTHYPKVRQAV